MRRLAFFIVVVACLGSRAVAASSACPLVPRSFAAPLSFLAAPVVANLAFAENSLHTDGMGSVGALVPQNGTAATAGHFRYDAYGNFRTSAHPGDCSADPSGLTCNAPLTYTGHLYDAESNLFYFGARYYDPETGRFLTNDPVTGDALNPPSLHKYLYAYDSPMVYTDPWGEYALNNENEQFNPDVTNQYDVQRMRTLVEHATSERGQHPAFRGDYESIVTAANSPRTKDWNEEARLSLYRLYSELYDSSVPQNDFGFVYTENAPESLHQNGWTHIKDFATARVPLGTRVKTGAAASAAALVAIVAPEAIAVTGIYGQAALWTGLGFAAVKETAVASIEGPATRAREIRDEITRPWRENDPVGAALQFGGLAGFGLSFSPAVQSVTRPLMQRAAGAIEANVTSALGNFGQMGEGSEVMAASDRMFQDVGLHRQAAQSGDELLTLYRGERAGTTVMKSYAARQGGYAYSKSLIENGNLADLMQAHALDSTNPASPFISTTSDPNVAKFFAGSNGVVHELRISVGRAIANPFNNMVVPAGPGGSLVSESEFLVPNYIRPSEIVR